jgi:hypothetical protein
MSAAARSGLDMSIDQQRALRFVGFRYHAASPARRSQKIVHAGALEIAAGVEKSADSEPAKTNQTVAS